MPQPPKGQKTLLAFACGVSALAVLPLWLVVGYLVRGHHTVLGLSPRSIEFVVAAVLTLGWIVVVPRLVRWPWYQRQMMAVVYKAQPADGADAELLDAAFAAVCARAGIADATRYALMTTTDQAVTGLTTPARVIVVHNVLLNYPVILEAVLAHELGHHHAGHMDLAGAASLYLSPYLCLDRTAARILEHRFAAFVALSLFTFGTPFLVWPALNYLQLITRRDEYTADQFAAALGYSEALSDFLQASIPVVQPSWLAAHVEGWIAGCLPVVNAHPSPAKRTARLERHA